MPNPDEKSNPIETTFDNEFTVQGKFPHNFGDIHQSISEDIIAVNNEQGKRKVEFWNLKTNERVSTIPSSFEVRSLAILPNGNLIVGANKLDDECSLVSDVQIWNIDDIKNPKLVIQLPVTPETSGNLVSVKVLNEKQIVLLFNNKMVIYDLDKKSPLYSIPSNIDNGYHKAKLDLAKDDTLFAASKDDSGENFTIKLWHKNDMTKVSNRIKSLFDSVVNTRFSETPETLWLSKSKDQSASDIYVLNDDTVLKVDSFYNTTNKTFSIVNLTSLQSFPLFKVVFDKNFDQFREIFPNGLFAFQRNGDIVFCRSKTLDNYLNQAKVRDDKLSLLNSLFKPQQDLSKTKPPSKHKQSSGNGFFSKIGFQHTVYDSSSLYGPVHYNAMTGERTTPYVNNIDYHVNPMNGNVTYLNRT